LTGSTDWARAELTKTASESNALRVATRVVAESKLERI